MSPSSAGPATTRSWRGRATIPWSPGSGTERALRRARRRRPLRRRPAPAGRGACAWIHREPGRELAANTTNDSETITGLATTSGLTKGQIVSGAGIVAGSVISSIVSATVITISNPATATANAVNTRFRFEHARGAGHAHCRQRQQRTVRRQRRRRLDRLYGHPADWPVRARIRAGRDLLEGGSGNDLLIAGPGSPVFCLYGGLRQ